MEIWKDIEGYEGLYQINSEGIVRNKKGCIRKSKLKKDGYVSITLCKNGEHKTFLVHRLVATAFIPNPNNYTIINHINEDKTDNRVENLEWCSKSYNNTYGTRIEKVFYKLSKPVLQFTKDGKLVKKWENTTHIKNELGFSSSSINSCCKGRLKTAYGYKWCYHYKSLWERKHIPLIKQKKVA